MTFRKSFSLLTLVLVLLSSNVRAQFQMDLTSSSPKSGLGNDFWLAIPQNYEDESGKYIYLYATSPVATVVHVETSMGSMQKSIGPNEVAAINLPLGWEMKSSGYVEDKGIRVWAAEGLNVQLMSHNPYTSDLTGILPMQSCGTDYIVAAYQGSDAGGYDYPSEFAISSIYDSNRISITPTCDLRGYDSNHVHPAGQQFFVTLNRWQSIQFKSNRTEPFNPLDVTGTRIQSLKPVSVMGAAQCAEIPAGYPYCDHLLEMMSPIQSWGNVYYTAPSFERRNGDTYLVVSSAAGQIIMRQGTTTGDHPEVFSDSQYATYWLEIDEGSKWYSDKPFYLVQYLNSATFDCSSCGYGDPSEMVVYPLSIGTKYFQTPTLQGSQLPYIHYVNLTVNRAASATTTFDGKKVTDFPKIIIDSEYEIFRAMNVSTGSHRLESDSATAIVFYGYGSYECYGASAAPPLTLRESPDTLAPIITIDSGKLCTIVTVIDSGSGLLPILYSNVVNLKVTITGAEQQNIVKRDSVILCVVDKYKPASCELQTTDISGNSTHAIITRAASPFIADTGYVVINVEGFYWTPVGEPRTQAIATILDTSTTALTIDSAWSTEPAFTYDPQRILVNTIPFTLQPQQSGKVAFTFAPTTPGWYTGIAYIRIRESGTINIKLEGQTKPPAAVQDPVLNAHNNGFTDWMQKGSGSFLLLPASPNPTTGTLNITYGLRNPANVSIAIFDLLGNRVYNFAFESQSGLSQQSIDLRMLSSATYFYRVEANGQVQTGRFSIAR